MPIINIGYDYSPVGMGMSRGGYGISGISGISGLGDMPGNVIIGTVGASAGGMFASIAPLLGIAGPWGLAIGGVVAGITSLLGAFGVGSGCGQTCVYASGVVDQLEPYLKQNVDNWKALAPQDKTLVRQQQALQVFNFVWSQVTQACSAPSLGDAGKRCISDRQRGGKWDWFSYYYDPIANDTVADEGTVTGSLTAELAPVLGGNGLMYLGAGLVVVVGIILAAK